MNTNEKIEHTRQAARGSLRSLETALEEALVPKSPVLLPTFKVATAPDATQWTGHIIFVEDGAAGDPVVAYSDGTNWLRCDTAAAVASA